MTLSKEGISGINAIYYKINGSNTYEMTTDNSITLNVNSGSTYYYYGVPLPGSTMSSCTELSPCSGIMSGNVTKKLSSTVSTSDSYSVTIIRKLVGVSETQLALKSVNAGESFSYDFSRVVTNIFTQYYYSAVTCTNGQKRTVDVTSSNVTLRIASVTANTTCTITYTTNDTSGGSTATE